MAKYVDITKAEFERELRKIEKDLDLAHPFEILPLDGTGEYVYATRVYSPTNRERPLSLRIFSSIVADGHARDVGADAIRVNVMTFKNLVRHPEWKRADELRRQQSDYGLTNALEQKKIPQWIPERIYPAVKGKRVHRVEGWRKNLRSRIQSVIGEIF
jgi:hypothetical protein